MPYLTTRKNLKLQLSPGLVASYDIQPGNGVGLFWDTHMVTYLLICPEPHGKKKHKSALYHKFQAEILYIEKTTVKPGAAGDKAAQNKIDKNARLASTHIFYPFSIETAKWKPRSKNCLTSRRPSMFCQFRC